MAEINGGDPITTYVRPGGPSSKYYPVGPLERSTRGKLVFRYGNSIASHVSLPVGIQIKSTIPGRLFL